MTKITSTVLITTLSLLFTGCGQQPFPGNTIKDASIFHDENKSTGVQILKTPELNIEKTVEIGENLYKKINQITYNTYKLTLDEDTESKLFNGGFIKTHNLKITDKTNQPLYLWNNKKAMCINAGYDYTLKRPIKVCLVDKNDNGYFDMATYSYKIITYPLSNDAKYTVKPTPPSYNQDSFKYEALYQGKKGNSIKISFREFKDNMARPAFTQDIDYELNKDGTAMVGFKGLRIEILKATNMDITYKVIKDYN
jgi:hypothetical protein